MEELTLEIAKELTRAMWAHLAETGGDWKEDWPGYDEAIEKYGPFIHICPLCQYVKNKGVVPGGGVQCHRCPYYVRFGSCTADSGPYWKWIAGLSIEVRKIHAKTFLEQLEQL